MVYRQNVVKIVVSVPTTEARGFSYFDTSQEACASMGETRHIVPESTEAITEVKAYPNPFQQDITLEIPESYGKEVTVLLFNAQGQSIDEMTVPTGKTTLPTDKSMSAGMYFLRITSGNHTETIKIIKQ